MLLLSLPAFSFPQFNFNRWYSFFIGLGQPPVELKDFDNLDLSGMKIGIDWEYFKVILHDYLMIIPFITSEEWVFFISFRNCKVGDPNASANFQGTLRLNYNVVTFYNEKKNNLKSR